MRMTLMDVRAEVQDLAVEDGLERFNAAQEYKMWVATRCEMLLEDDANAAFVSGYARCALGMLPDFAKYVGDPFGADDHHAGYGLAEYEVGPSGADVERGVAA